MSVLYGKVRVNAKNKLPYDSTIRTFPYPGYGTVMDRDDETGILTLNGTSESGRLYYLTSKSGAWLPTNNYVGMKLKCYGTNLNNFYANVRYFNSSTATEYVKQVNVKSDEYTIENYPYFVISADFNGNVTFNNDLLEIILHNTNQITVTSALGLTKTVNMPTGATYVDIPLAGLEEYTLTTTNSGSETVLLNYGDFKEVTLPISIEDVSWEYVSNAIKNGTFSSLASVGDTKSFVMNGKTYHAEVVSINDGTGSAGSWYPNKTVDFICKELYETTYQYNSSATNTGGFPSSALRGTLVNTLYPLLPSDLKDVIIAKSHSYITSTSGAMGTDSTNLWLPTHYEIAGTTDTSAPGETSSNNKAYTLASKIKYLNGQSSANYWWLGSLNSYTSAAFWTVSGAGSPAFLNAGSNVTSGVPICFRIG